MSTILEFLGTDHGACDERFATAEEAVAQKQWQRARRDFGQFETAMERHFAMEEQVLFPAFEASTRMTSGPTQVMRIKHDQMRSLIREMGKAIETSDQPRYLGLSETLNMLLQQHNVKEESMLYPMSDRVLGEDSNKVVQDMNALAK